MYTNALAAIIVDDMSEFDQETIVSHMRDIAYGINPIYSMVGYFSEREFRRFYDEHKAAVWESFTGLCAEMGEDVLAVFRNYRAYRGYDALATILEVAAQYSAMGWLTQQGEE